MRRLSAALILLACASPGMPPGGPPDVAAPKILAIIPDSGTVGVSPKEVIFQFDEVVSERPPAATTLADLFLISPRDGSPAVSWHREAITVRPRRGWRANTPYTVIMLPGIADIRGNVRNTGASTFFSTGRTIPRTRITGRVFDWVAGTPAAGGLVESFVPPDSIHAYIALVDSSGTFAIEHVPHARYKVRAYLDRNRNNGIDPGEPWDSVSVTLADSATATLLVFAHDSLPPRIRDVTETDSATLRMTFDKPVDPSQTLTAANFAVIGPDSLPIPIASAGAPLKDTVAAVKPLMPRPSPTSEAVIKLGRPLAPKTVYRIRAIGIRGLLGNTGDSERAHTTPAPPPPSAPKAVVPPPATPIKR
ncbi:MAG TPA: Ig-like domain-containing protein [Gemmatimonadaceae bacterium]|nr:Ig-like domain-containing protein [Gemmatimonadaceae bacterium]